MLIRTLVKLDAIAVFQQVIVHTLAVGGERDLPTYSENPGKPNDILSAPVQAHALSNLTYTLRANETAATVRLLHRHILADLRCVGVKQPIGLDDSTA